MYSNPLIQLLEFSLQAAFTLQNFSGTNVAGVVLSGFRRMTPDRPSRDRLQANALLVRSEYIGLLNYANLCFYKFFAMIFPYIEYWIFLF